MRGKSTKAANLIENA